MVMIRVKNNIIYQFWSSLVWTVIINKIDQNHSRMKSFAFAALASAATAISADELEFLNYAARFNKVYEQIEEYALRLEQFTRWHKIINDHN